VVAFSAPTFPELEAPAAPAAVVTLICAPADVFWIVARTKDENVIWLPLMVDWYPLESVMFSVGPVLVKVTAADDVDAKPNAICEDVKLAEQLPDAPTPAA
jgi:hypothetical protein